MTLPLVSVVIPTYNHAKYLPMCLDSIWFQDYPNLEIIVVNAASPDNTTEVLNQYQKSIREDQVSFAKYFNEDTGEVERQVHQRYSTHGRRLDIVTLDKDPGLPETYNVGLKRAKGEYILPIVSDDIAHSQLASELVSAMESGFDFAYGDLIIVDDLGHIVRQFRFPEFDPKTCLADWYLLGVARGWRACLHQKVGYMDPEYPLVHDYELILRFAMAGAKFKHIPKTLYSIRHHGADRKTGSHTTDREPRIHSESKKVALRGREWLKKVS